ncbi:HNH endonuclease [Pseudomonas syringae]|uniref:HNH endonuclease n=1 Tax=Pseudomonas syringae TaxID=317 RepID=UPI000F00943B|nr:HNH endonuclease signature motif containing protein [Pseudomonas syringae]
MMRLSEPNYTFEQVIEACISGITGNAALKSNVGDEKDNLISAGTHYSTSSRNGALYLLRPIDCSVTQNPVVLGALMKSDLIKLYETYFVPEEKPGREIYDKILNAAMESCPFCGGIGTPRNLDHFLPKSHFPQFSVLPVNLVPSCRDCNMDGKSAAFANQAQNQIIQPYLDNDRFFLAQWIFASYADGANGAPGEFNYYAQPPADWSATDKQRAMKHFEDFNLSHRYGVKAAQLLGTVIAQIGSLRRVGLSKELICETILDPGVMQAQFPNHWQRGFYQALKASLLGEAV